MALFGRETERDRARAESWARWARQQNVLALVSLVLGIFSLIEFGALVVFGIGGIATGAIALRQLRRAEGPSDVAAAPATEPDGARASVGAVEYARGRLEPSVRALDYERDEPVVPRTQGRPLAWAGIVTSVISLLLAVALYRGRIG